MRKLGIAICLSILLLLVGACLSFASSPDEGDLGVTVNQNDSVVQITWNPPPYSLLENPKFLINSAQIQYYIIERSTSDYPTVFYRLAKLPANVYSYVDNSVEPGKKYGYCITASVSDNVYGIDHIYQRSPLIKVSSESTSLEDISSENITTTNEIPRNIAIENTPPENTTTAQHEKQIILLTIDSTDMFVNGNKIQLDTTPKIENGRTLVPLRAISEALDAKVIWDEETQTIIIEK